MAKTALSERVTPSTAHGGALRDSQGRNPSRAQIAAWIALLLVALFLSLSRFEAYQLGTYLDDSRYAILARSIAQSDQYGAINAPGEPGRERYPFGYPLLLAPLVLLFPDNLGALKALSLLATLLNAAILFWLWPRFGTGRSHWWGVAVAGLYLLSPLTIDLSRQVMSEPVFTTFCLLVLLLTQQAARGKLPYWWSSAFSVALTFAIFTRTIGIVMMAVVLPYLVLTQGRGFWKVAVLAIAQMALLVGLVVGFTSVRLGDLVPSEYLRKDGNAALIVGLLATPMPSEWRGQLLENPAMARPPTPSQEQDSSGGQERVDDREANRNAIADGATQQARGVRIIALPAGDGLREQALARSLGIPFLPLVLPFLMYGLVLFGLLRQLSKRRLTAFSLFTFVYLGSLYFWLWNHPRLLYPIVPQIHFGLLSGMEGVLLAGSRLARRTGPPSIPIRMVLVGLVLLLGVVSIWKSSQIDDSRLHAGDLEARTRWISLNSSASDIVLTEAPETDFLYVGRKTVGYPRTLTTASQLEDFLTSRGIRYVLVAPAIRWQDSYRPEYSPITVRMLSLLETLRSQNRVKLVQSAEPDLVRVYETAR